MRMWEAKVAELTVEEMSVDGLPPYLRNSINEWLGITGKLLGGFDGLKLSTERKFRTICLDVGGRYDNNVRYQHMMMDLLDKDFSLGLAVLDYQLDTVIPKIAAERLERILKDVGHKYRVNISEDGAFLTERISEEEIAVLTDMHISDLPHAKQMRNAFRSLYGEQSNQNNIESIQESFKATESILKRSFPGTGSNLGKIIKSLEDNRSLIYAKPSENQKSEDASRQFLEMLKFINESGRAIKHGSAEMVPDVSKEHAEVVYRQAVVVIKICEEHLVILKDNPND